MPHIIKKKKKPLKTKKQFSKQNRVLSFVMAISLKGELSLKCFIVTHLCQVSSSAKVLKSFWNYSVLLSNVLGFTCCLTHQASLLAQLVKNLPAMQESLVRCREDPLEKG